jgi:hypothetical protein
VLLYIIRNIRVFSSHQWVLSSAGFMRLVGWLEWSSQISGRNSQNIPKRKENVRVPAQPITSERSDARVLMAVEPYNGRRLCQSAFAIV